MTGSPLLIDDCFLHDKDRLQHNEALELLANNMGCVVGDEQIDASKGLQRILAGDVSAPHNVPLHTNAAVDGYAFCHADLKPDGMAISARIAAGDLDPASLKQATAVRIFTGAPMPMGADTVAMQEDCDGDGALVNIPMHIKAGANCRMAGEDLKAGEKVFDAGTRLKAADLAALASIGKHKLQVRKKLRVALFSNGNEMRDPAQHTRDLLPGEVYDANQPLLAALLSSLPIDLHQMGIIRDNRDEARRAIDDASKIFDVILTTGGASRGAEDYMLSILDELGKRHLWQLAVKPGRPMMFGQIPRSEFDNDCLFFGLPGNPVAAMVCFLLYVRPAFLALAGSAFETPKRFPLPAGFEIKAKKPDRREFIRGILKTKADGSLVADKFSRDGSGLISSLREADGLIEIPEDVTTVNKGQFVNFIPFSSFD